MHATAAQRPCYDALSRCRVRAAFPQHMVALVLTTSMSLLLWSQFQTCEACAGERTARECQALPRQKLPGRSRHGIAMVS